MLMLGESIFSLLIVNVNTEGNSFFTVFYCGLLTVVFLQILHFQSQPHDADSHAMRRSKNAGIVWRALQCSYSFALVVLGAAFTFFLVASDESYGRRRLDRDLSDTTTALSATDKQAAAHMFCGSLAIIFFSLDGMILTHLGFDESQDRCVVKGGRMNLKGIFVLGARVGLLVFAATLSQWQTQPKYLSIAGLLLVFAQQGARKLGGIYLSSHHNQAHEAESHEHGGHGEHIVLVKSDSATGESKWPNVTHARAEDGEEDDAVS
jgi:hypothetical protein